MIEKLAKRRSIRRYTSEHIPENKIKTIMTAALMSPTSRNLRPWKFLVVQDKELLLKLTDAREGSADMLKTADAAVIVTADTTVNDVWIEDCSIAMSNMHITAAEQGVGSCWIQIRNRRSRIKGITSEEYVRKLFDLDETYAVEAVLSLGIASEKRPDLVLDESLWEKVQYYR